MLPCYMNFHSLIPILIFYFSLEYKPHREKLMCTLHPIAWYTVTIQQIPGGIGLIHLKERERWRTGLMVAKVVFTS